MSYINWIHVIDDKGSPIYIYESYAQGAKENNWALLAHLLIGLKSVALGINNEEIKTVQMSNNKFFIAKDCLTNFIFILKTQTEVNSEEIVPILTKVREIFIRKYAAFINKNFEERKKALESFKDIIWKMLNLGKKYMDNLKID
jgi:hypothetical protein